MQIAKSPNELRGLASWQLSQNILSATCTMLAGERAFFPNKTAQYAFTPGRNYLQLLLAQKLLIETCLEWRLELVMGAADIWKAYDRTKYTFLMESMLQRRIARCLVAAWIRVITGSRYNYILDERTESGPCPKRRGVDQGDPAHTFSICGWC